MYSTVVKPFFDFAAAFVLLLLLSPLILIIILLLAVDNKGKIFFAQQRPGKDEKLFYLYKFRTMNERRDASGNLLPDMERITFTGRILRLTSLDELLQLFTV